MIVRTEAISLRSMDYGETSRIVTLYTRKFGTIAVMAKGARLPKSRFGSSIQPLSYAQVVLYYKPNRDLQTLSESSHVYPMHGLARSLDKLTVGLRIVDLMRSLLPEQDADPMAFNLLLQVLTRLDQTEARAENLLLYFQLRLANLLGFTPAFDRASVEALPDDGGLLVLENGTIAPLHASTAGMWASRGTLRAFAICSRADLEAVMRMRLTPEQLAETASLVEAYLRYHTETHYPARSGKIIGQMSSRRPSSPS